MHQPHCTLCYTIDGPFPIQFREEALTAEVGAKMVVAARGAGGKAAAAAAANDAYEAELDRVLDLGWAHADRSSFEAFAAELAGAPASVKGALQVCYPCLLTFPFLLADVVDLIFVCERVDVCSALSRTKFGRCRCFVLADQVHFVCIACCMRHKGLCSVRTTARCGLTGLCCCAAAVLAVRVDAAGAEC